MVAVITAVLAGSSAALAAILISDHALTAALISGGLVALLVLGALTRFQHSAWVAASTTPITEDED